MGILDSLVKRFAQQGILEYKVKLSESAYHIRIQNENIKSENFVPGYFIRLGVGVGNDELSFKDKVRSYSVWNIDKAKGTIDLAIATHGTGVGTKWITQCEVGTSVSFVWKKGNFLLDDSADSYLMIGDLCALSHLYVINRNLPKNKIVESIVYNKHKSELFTDMDGDTPFDFYEMPQNPIEEITSKLKEMVPKMTGKKMVYVGGDGRLCIALNEYFKKECNWQAQTIKTKPFWIPNKKGLE